jgi:hypothetical protein
MPIIRTAFLAAILTVVVAAPAAALSYRDIGGRWCGEHLEYDFGRNSLTVRFDDGTPTRHFVITGFEYSGGDITMHWLNKGERLRTVFSEFSDNDRFMAQQKNSVGPRRPFHRCY